MTRRIKRSRDFEITLEVKSEDSIQPPRDAQRNWVLNRAIKEFADDLTALDIQACNFIRGSEIGDFEDHGRANMGAQQIMEDWQIPVMQAMAGAVSGSHGDVLEIGFGRGIESDFIQEGDVASHTIVECNAGVIRECQVWREQRPDCTGEYRTWHVAGCDRSAGQVRRSLFPYLSTE